MRGVRLLPTEGPRIFRVILNCDIDLEYDRSPESVREVAPFPTSSTYALRSRELMLTQDEE